MISHLARIVVVKIQTQKEWLSLMSKSRVKTGRLELSCTIAHNAQSLLGFLELITQPGFWRREEAGVENGLIVLL